MFGQLITLSVQNLMRARTRMLMTSGGIMVATAGIILLIAFTLGLQDAAESGLGSNTALTQIVVTSLGSGPDTTTPQLTIAALQKLSRIQGVKAVIPMVNLVGSQLIASGKTTSCQIIGVDPTLLPFLGVTVQSGNLGLATGQAVSGSDAGKNFSSMNSKTRQFEPIAIDLMTARVKLQLTENNTAPPTTRETPLKVIASLRSGTDYDNVLFMPFDDVIAMNAWVTNTKFDPKKFVYDQVIVRSESREVTHQVAQAIDKQLGYSTKSMGDLLDQMNSFFSTMHLMLGGIGLITLLIAASGVANTMMMATHERTKEIGLMKAIGGTDEDILTIFLLEAGLIGLGGSLGGVGISLLLQDTINRGIQNLSTSQGQGTASFLPVNLLSLKTPIIIPPNLALFAIALAIVVSVMAGLYPALWASRLQPVIALKQE